MRKPGTSHCSLLVVAFLVFMPLRAEATECFVDQGNAGANDANTGAIDRPWKTITKANNTLVAGDTVYIKAGTYATYVGGRCR